MKTLTKAVALKGAALALLAGVPASSNQTLLEALDSVGGTAAPVVVKEEEKQKAEAKAKEKTRTYICKYCSPREQQVLAFFQDHGVTDKYALATIMGNIRQESMFIPNICEGGARVSYGSCRYGGYGLIQWTTSDRYHGLGRHSRSKGLNPSTLDGQLSWLVQEHQWKRIEGKMKTPGLSIGSYMNAAYSWLGWGIHGARTHYANDYARRIVLSES